MIMITFTFLIHESRFLKMPVFSQEHGELLKKILLSAQSVHMSVRGACPPRLRWGGMTL